MTNEEMEKISKEMGEGIKAASDLAMEHLQRADTCLDRMGKGDLTHEAKQTLAQTAIADTLIALNCNVGILNTTLISMTTVLYTVLNQLVPEGTSVNDKKSDEVV